MPSQDHKEHGHPTSAFPATVLDDAVEEPPSGTGFQLELASICNLGLPNWVQGPDLFF